MADITAQQKAIEKRTAVIKKANTDFNALQFCMGVSGDTGHYLVVRNELVTLRKQVEDAHNDAATAGAKPDPLYSKLIRKFDGYGIPSTVQEKILSR